MRITPFYLPSIPGRGVVVATKDTTMTKKILFPMLAIFLLGGGVYLSRALGLEGPANFLDAQAASFMAAYHAAKAEKAAQDAAEIAAEVSATTAQ
jgi:hypothetical protein